jgi:hypothetical protein
MPLRVSRSAAEQLRSNLDDIHLTHVEGILASEPDLDVAHVGWPDPRVPPMTATNQPSIAWASVSSPMSTRRGC